MEEYVKKILILGDYAVGKTSLRRTFMGESFSSNYIPTLGADFSHYHLENIGDDNKVIDFSIWDLAGQPNYTSIRPVFFNGANGAIVVLDITRKDTLQNVSNWINELYEGASRGIPVIMVANKEDLREENADIISVEDIEQYNVYLSQEYDIEIPLYHTSAKTGLNANEVFEKLADLILKHYG